jgi:hypothetical protein
MAEKAKVWRDGEWVCLLVDDGVSKSTVSLTVDEARDLRDYLSAYIIGAYQHMVQAPSNTTGIPANAP